MSGGLDRERIAQPFDRGAPIAIAVDADDVESSGIPGEVSTGRQEHFGRADEPALLVIIDRQDGPGEAAVRAIAYFDKDQAIVIEHDQVDLSMTATVIARYGAQALIPQESECELLGVVP